jgi:hypothetical protein
LIILIILGEKYKLWKCSLFSFLQPPVISFPWIPSCQTSLACVFPIMSETNLHVQCNLYAHTRTLILLLPSRFKMKHGTK